MECNPKKTEQGKVSPFIFIRQGKLSADRDGNSENDHSHGKAQPVTGRGLESSKRIVFILGSDGKGSKHIDFQFSKSCHCQGHNRLRNDMILVYEPYIQK
jgi:hypothetical protein